MSVRALLLLSLGLSLGLGAWSRVDALKSGLWADDYMHHAMLAKVFPSERAPWDLFHFVDGHASDLARMVDFGVDPWWTHPEFQLSLLRPLPSLLRAFDYQLFGIEGLPQHLHSFAWWVCMVLVAAALLFEVLPKTAAAWALLFFSIDESQTIPVLWLSNRSALVANTFSLAALWCHVKFRKNPAASWRWASVCCFALALTCGEYAIASCGYIVCLELFSKFRGTSRLRALAPMLALIATFLITSAVLGYGSKHSALYTSPFTAPLDYAQKLPTGLPAMLGDLVLGIPADWWSFGSPWPEELRSALGATEEQWSHLPSWRSWQVAFGVVSAILAAALFFWLDRRLEQKQRVAIRWLFAGALLALFPVLSSFVTSRLALPASIGFAALFGSAAAHCIEVWAAPRASNEPSSPTAGIAPRTWLVFVVATLALYLHGYLAFKETRRSTDFYTYSAKSRSLWALSLLLDEQLSASQQVVMISSADANDAPHFPFVRYAHGRSLVRGFRLLSGSPAAHEVYRVDPSTIEVRVLDDYGLSGSFVGSLTRAWGDRLPVGSRVRVPGMVAEVLETHHDQPVVLRFRFDVSLEDPSLVFIKSTEDGLRRLTLPSIGESIVLDPPTMPSLNLLRSGTRKVAK